MTIHLVEQGGRGGVYQHTVEVARLLAADGCDVVLHTANDREILEASGVEFCQCVRWFRAVRPRIAREVLLAVYYLAVTVPHLMRRCRRRTVHIQGSFGRGLFAPTVAALSMVAGRSLFSPHNTFTRSGSRLESALLGIAIRCPDVVVCFSGEDVQRLTDRGARRVVQSSLVQFVPPVSEPLRQAWRDRISPVGLPVVLLVGQLRPDKGIEDFLEAAELTAVPAHFVIVGEDGGFAAQARTMTLRSRVPVLLIVEYLAMADFVALLACADIVVAPYRQASSSGVVAVANQLGVRTLAYPVGGLRESATYLTTEPSVAALAEGIERALTQPAPTRLRQDYASELREIYGSSAT